MPFSTRVVRSPEAAKIQDKIKGIGSVLVCLTSNTCGLIGIILLTTWSDDIDTQIIEIKDKQEKFIQVKGRFIRL